MYTHKLIWTFSQLTLLSAILGITACTGDELTGSESASSTDASLNDDFITNPGIVSHDNFILLASTLTPAVIDPTTGSYKFTEVTITVKLGDKRNQRLTDAHTINFATEWGLITPSCVTSNGECSVIWNTSTSDQAPTDDEVTITAYTIGEESFDDENGNFIFDDDDLSNSFRDLTEPYVDVDRSTTYDPAEPIIDVVNVFDPTGANNTHDPIDSKLSSPGCTHSSLCSTAATTVIWNDLELDLNGPPVVVVP